MILISAFANTFNNASALQQCLASLKFCDESIVLDSDLKCTTRLKQERQRVDA